MDGRAAWFAVRTSSRHEKQVHERLSGRGIESFLPLLERWSRWKDRRMRIQVPLFPGYCFARFEAPARSAVVTVAGVVGIAGTSRGPEPIAEREIESLQALVRSRIEYDPYPGLTRGMEVEVVRGPLMGARGVLIRREPRCRLVISVNVLRQGAAVEIDAADVVPV
jgi:transcription antitermination factor NusG